MNFLNLFQRSLYFKKDLNIYFVLNIKSFKLFIAFKSDLFIQINLIALRAF